MFSTMPSTGTWTCRNISRPLRASMRLTSCGVVTLTAPDHRLLRLDEEAHGHELDPVLFQRELRGVGVKGAGDAHHDGDAGAVDVGVHQADARASRLEGQREVGRHGGFADAALAAGDG